MPIDVSDLTEKTYDAILVESSRFDDNLTLQFGLLSYECDDELVFIRKSEKHIRKMLKYNMDTIDDIFFGEPPTKAEFHRILTRLLNNIEKLKKSKPHN
jgi:hypothetical protein